MFDFPRSHSFFAFIYLLALSLSLQGFGTSLQQDRHRVSIVVQDRNRDALEGALVFVNDSTDLDGVTNEDGLVEYWLGAGDYLLFAYMPDYLDHYSMFRVEDSDLELEATLAPALSWSTSPSNPPLGIGSANGVRIAAAGEKLYFHVAVGGTPGMPGATAHTDFFEYDPVTDLWTALPNAPFGGQYGISTAYGPTPGGQDAIYIIRGYWSGQRIWLARFNIENGQWETGLSHQIPWDTGLAGLIGGGTGFQDYPRNGAVMVWDGQDHMYLFPGSGYNYFARDWYRYSVSQDSWEALDTLPHIQGPGNAAVLVEAGTAGLDQDYLYVQFGLAPSGDYSGAEFWRYGLETGIWEQKKAHGYGADDGSMLAWDGTGFLYHIPGAWKEQPWDRNLEQKREFMRYDLASDSWNHMEYSPYNRWGGWDDGGGMVRLGQTIYALKGGSDVSWAIGDNIAGGGSVPSNKFWKFSIPQETLELKMSVKEGSGRIFPVEGSHAMPPSTEVRLMAIPDSGYVFCGWLRNGQPFDQEAYTTLVVRRGALMEAIFESEGTGILEVPHFEVLQAYFAHGTLFLNNLPGPGKILAYSLRGQLTLEVEIVNGGNHSLEFRSPAGLYVIRYVGVEPRAPVKVMVY